MQLNCQSNEEFFSLKSQKIYSLSQNNGYNELVLNLSELFELIPIELIVGIYLKLLTDHIISFFNDIQILNIVILYLNIVYILYNLIIKLIA